MANDGFFRPWYNPTREAPPPTARVSQSETLKGVLNDLLDSELGRRQAEGTAPTFAGITTPRAPVEDAAEAFDQMKGWSQEHIMDKRGQAFEDANPSEDDYRSRRYRFLKESEGARTWAYDDKDGKDVHNKPVMGNVTVGIGFNMDRPDARKVFTSALGVNDETFDQVKAGRRPLNSSQVRRLFDFTIQEAEGIVKNKFSDVPLTDNQRMALVSLAFNSPALIGPNLTRQVKEGDWESATYEILWRSNRTNHRGLAARRYREAAMFAGHPNVATGQADGKSDALVLLPGMSNYLSNFS